ncbi:MAG: molybdopterin-dependent oxidoreductase, partial [Chloroflexota bacterium]|nr:molybdopterin-dependent oxidoreductase [Chloroflexota bacterium]
SLRRAFGTEVLPADMTALAQAKTILVVADDLESSHNVACLRVKDAVVRNGARLMVVTPRWGELCDFAQVWLRPRPGEEAGALAALAPAGGGSASGGGALDEPGQAPAPGPDQEVADSVQRAARILADAAREPAEEKRIAVVYAVPHLGAEAAGAVAAAVANLAIVCCGPEEAARCLFVLPAEANVWGLRDMGVASDLLPGHRPADDDRARQEVGNAWGLGPSTLLRAGLGFREMLAAAQQGRLKALVVLGDNPLFAAPDKAWVMNCLSSLDFLLVIDSLPSDTARLAQVVLPDVGVLGKDGTYTSADRRIVRLRAAVAPVGEARPAWQILTDLGAVLAQRLGLDASRWNYSGPAQIMEEIAALVPLYRNGLRLWRMESGAQQAFEGLAAQAGSLQPVAAEPAAAREGLVVSTGRTLYTSWEGATLHSPEADKLHREESAEINPGDAASLGVEDGQEVVLVNDHGQLTIRARVSESVQPGSLFVPLYYDGGAVTALFGREDGGLPGVRIAVRATA